MLLKELNSKGLTFLKSYADFFLPRLCPSCKNKLAVDEQFICSDCYSKIQKVSIDRLEVEFKRKFEKDKLISSFQSLFVFEKDKEFQSIAHELKYNGKFKIGFFLGRILAVNFQSIILEWHPDLIIPVPLHPLKKVERGYNQSFFIAKGIKSVLGIPVSDKIIKRKRFTDSQTTMTLLQRKENIKDAFEISSGKKVAGKTIIMLDDVITTGSTLNECARTLIESGAQKVYAVSAALAD